MLAKEILVGAFVLIQMTSISSQKIPPLGIFLNSVCPGINQLDSNIHFSIPVSEDSKSQSVDWSLNSNTLQRAKLNDTYLNVSRPYVGVEESRTYMSLPYHILKSFENSIAAVNKNGNSEGQLQIAANINPLVNDPFKLVHLNPGCLSVIVETELAVSPGTVGGAGAGVARCCLLVLPIAIILCT